MVSSAADVAETQAFAARGALPEIKGLQIRTLEDPRIVERIRVVDDYCLEVKYQDKYYDTYVRPCLHHFNQIALYYDILVGSCTCRLERTGDDDVFRLYVMTIAVLEPYRRLGIGSHLLQRILDNVSKENKVRIAEVTLHVQVGSPAMEFYQKFEFELVERVEKYYTDLKESNALLMRKVVPQPHFENVHPPKSKGGAKNGKKK